MRGTAVALALALFAVPAAAQSAQPLKLAPRPTSPGITEQDLMTRLYIFADDSMQGRQAGRIGNLKGNDYIARELRRLGVEPGGEKGSYFQELPFVVRKYTDKSRLMVDGQELRWLEDWVPVPGQAAPRPLQGAQVVYGGVFADTLSYISTEEANGKLVVLSPPTRGPSSQQEAQAVNAVSGRRFSGAAGIAMVDLHTLPLSARALLNDPPGRFQNPAAPRPQPAAVSVRITDQAAAQLFGRPLSGLQRGATGGTVTAQLDFVEQPVPQYARNVIGIIRGSDPALRGQYVAIGSHNDHVGFRALAVDHDSLRAVATAALARSLAGDSAIRPLTAEERASIRVNLDSLRRLRAARRDSINNGADDDGSGSMAMLEIAEALARSPAKPRRSILFVWHTAEESGLQGSRWFVENPTVPRDSIVAQINLDMIGRGRRGELPGGGEDYLGVVGAKRLSTELGEIVEQVNRRHQRPLKLDYRFDDDVTRTFGPAYNNIYNRSDHANYARHNIPIAFFFTGLHQDYHQVTDEPQYIDYPHYTRIVNYIRDLVVEIANRDQRPKVDKPGS